ncbi:hypothetical protein [Deinococcus fonticola]|uniref:hypothetical protein n=1 Tax=Deinococcus fonticola TaxID=2528713 RepID=UPI00107538D9|nr:hypothetical protein [Deinococcus fonticola]
MTGTLTISPSQAGGANTKLAFLLNPLVQLALFGLVMLFVGSFGSAQAFNFSKITGAICTVVTQLSAPALLGAAGFAVIIVFGWNKFIGDSSAFQGIKNAIVGAVVILGAGTFATAIFGGSC